MIDLMKLNKDANFLITTNQWFLAPDGKQYRAVWGKVAIYSDQETLGIKTNNKSANWYILVGSPEKRVIVAGCQVHYACVCNAAPYTGPVKEVHVSAEQAKNYDVELEGKIYLAQ